MAGHHSRIRYAPLITAYYLACHFQHIKAHVHGLGQWYKASQAMSRSLHTPLEYTSHYTKTARRSVTTLHTPLQISIDFTHDAIAQGPAFARQVKEAATYLSTRLSGSDIQCTLHHMPFPDPVIYEGFKGESTPDDGNILALAFIENNTIIIFDSAITVDGVFIVAAHELMHLIAFNQYWLEEGEYTTNQSHVTRYNNQALFIEGSHWTMTSPLSVGQGNDLMVPFITEDTKVSMETLLLPSDKRPGFESHACTKDSHCDTFHCVQTTSKLPGRCFLLPDHSHSDSPYSTFWSVTRSLLAIAVTAVATVKRCTKESKELK